MSFNPRAREGRDNNHRYYKCLVRCFNPRAREGRDRDASGKALNRDVSIHAPARGATQPGHSKPTPDAVSIHAPARGATQSCIVKPP